jgi:NADH:ubiquinone oxidoreductase subunit 3 (subunit A)
LIITISLFAIVFFLAARMGRWHFFQVIIFIAVMCSGVYFKWTVGGHATALLAVMIAFIATVLVSAVVTLLRTLRQRVSQREVSIPVESAENLKLTEHH